MEKKGLPVMCALCAALILVFSAGAAYAGENVFSFSGGVYHPVGDFVEDWDDGADLSFSYSRLFHRFLGVEVGLHSYSTEISNSEKEGDLETTGVETLLVFQPRDAQVQPYGGIGLGWYINDLYYRDKTTLIDGSGGGIGGILKGGLRFYPTDSFYLGFFGKVFSNIQAFESRWDGVNYTENLGGFTLDFELGFRF